MVAALSVLPCLHRRPSTRQIDFARDLFDASKPMSGLERVYRTVDRRREAARWHASALHLRSRSGSSFLGATPGSGHACVVRDGSCISPDPAVPGRCKPRAAADRLGAEPVHRHGLKGPRTFFLTPSRRPFDSFISFFRDRPHVRAVVQALRGEEDADPDAGRRTADRFPSSGKEDTLCLHTSPARDLDPVFSSVETWPLQIVCIVTLRPVTDIVLRRFLPPDAHAPDPDQTRAAL